MGVDVVTENSKDELWWKKRCGRAAVKKVQGKAYLGGVEEWGIGR